MSRPLTPCPEELVPLLGTLSDAEIATRGGVSHPTARRWRRALGIDPYGESGAVRTSLTAATTRKRLDALRARLGALSWAHLAARCGVSRQRMHEARREGASAALLRAWEAAAMVSDVVRATAPAYVMPDGVAPLLGVLSDSEIGRRYEVPRQVVARWRRTAGKAAVPREGRPTVGRLSPEATRARLERLAWAHGCSTWAALGRVLGVGRGCVPAGVARGLTERTIAAWEAVPVRAPESATS